MTDVRCLTLFSGTHSVSKALAELKVPTSEVTLDFAEPADLSMDILEFDYTMFKPRAFNFIWASPDCTMYSKARTCGGPRKLDYADSLVLRTLEIIDWLQPECYVIENPESGLLKTRNFMLLRPYYVADYCMYGLMYRKRTAFWSNMPLQLKTCCSDRPCPWLLHGKHVTGLQDQQHGKGRGAIPIPLLVSIFEQALDQLA